MGGGEGVVPPLRPLRALRLDAQLDIYPFLSFMSSLPLPSSGEALADREALLPPLRALRVDAQRAARHRGRGGRRVRAPPRGRQGACRVRAVGREGLSVELYVELSVSARVCPEDR